MRIHFVALISALLLVMPSHATGSTRIEHYSPGIASPAINGFLRGASLGIIGESHDSRVDDPVTIERWTPEMTRMMRNYSRSTYRAWQILGGFVTISLFAYLYVLLRSKPSHASAEEGAP